MPKYLLIIANEWPTACDFTAVCIPDLALQNSVPATDLRDLSRFRNQISRELPEHLEAHAHLEVIERS